MKTIEYLILTAIFTLVLLQNAAGAQTAYPYLYVVVQHSDNSSNYDANYQRLNNEVIAKYSKNEGVVFVNFNVSNDEISANTKSELDWYSIYNTAYQNNGEEGIIIIDPINKNVIERLSLDAGTKAILKSIAKGSQMMARANQ